MQLVVAQGIKVMQNAIPEDNSMTAQAHREEEPLHVGSKRRSPPTVHSDDELAYPESPSSEKIVQTTKSKGIVNVQLFIRSKYYRSHEREAYLSNACSLISWYILDLQRPLP